MMVIAQKSFVHNFSFIPYRLSGWRTQTTLPLLRLRQIVMYFAEQKYKWRHAIREINRFNIID